MLGLVVGLVYMVCVKKFIKCYDYIFLIMYLVGFEMFSDFNDRGFGYIIWVVNGKKLWMMYFVVVGFLFFMNIG